MRTGWRYKSTHICRLQDHAYYSDTAIVLGDDGGVGVQSLDVRLVRVINVAYHHWTVDSLQEGHHSFNTVIELVIADGLELVRIKVHVIHEYDTQNTVGHGLRTHHSVGWLHVQEVAGGIPPEQVVPQCALEIVTRIQVDGI